MINKTVLAMRLGLILAFSYVVRDLVSLIGGDGFFSIVALFVSVFFLVFPFVFLFRMTVNYCCMYNGGKYQFYAPFSIAVKGFAFAGIIYTLCFYFYIKNFAPNIMVDMVNSYEKVAMGKGYDDMIAQWKSVAVTATPKSLVPSIYMGFILMGFIVSLISVGAARFAKMKPIGEGVDNCDNGDSNNKTESQDEYKKN